MQLVRGFRPSPENTTNHVAASVTVDKSLNQTCFFPLLFVQRISLYHIGIAQLLAYYRTADLGDVTPPPYIRLPMSSVWIYNATKFLDALMLEKLHISHLEDL